MQLSKHFTFKELTATDQMVDSNGDGLATNAEMLALNQQEAMQYLETLRRVANELLEPVRVGLGMPMTITSGYRGKTLNAMVKGSPTSQHCLGQAADFKTKGHDDRAGRIAVVRWMMEDFNCRGYRFGQLLLERGCIHISLGTKCEVAEAIHNGVKWDLKPIKELA